MAAHAFDLPEDKRDAKRSRLLLTAELQCAAGTIEVHLLNISQSGAKLDSETPPALDESILLVHNDLKVSGRVAWVEENRFGMSFDQPIDERYLITRGQHHVNG